MADLPIHDVRFSGLDRRCSDGDCARFLATCGSARISATSSPPSAGRCLSNVLVQPHGQRQRRLPGMREASGDATGYSPCRAVESCHVQAEAVSSPSLLCSLTGRSYGFVSRLYLKVSEKWTQAIAYFFEALVGDCRCGACGCCRGRISAWRTELSPLHERSLWISRSHVACRQNDRGRRTRRGRRTGRMAYSIVRRFLCLRGEGAAQRCRSH